MIVFGVYLLVSGTGGEQASLSNLTSHGGFFPKGWFNQTGDGSYEGLLSAMALIMFSFGGLELVGITAAEAEHPEKKYPQSDQSGYLPDINLLCRRFDYLVFAYSMDKYQRGYKPFCAGV